MYTNVYGGVFLACVLALFGCKQFTDSIEEFLEYGTNEAAVIEASIPGATTVDHFFYVSSDKDIEVILKIRNPKQYSFLDSGGSPTSFNPTISGASPVRSMEQPDPNTIKLIYAADTLQKNEWGQNDIGGTLTLADAATGRVFKEKFTLKLKVNTPPPPIQVVIGKTKTVDASGKYCYVLCCTVPDMDKIAGSGKLHKDIDTIKIAIGETWQEFPLGLNPAATDFIKPTDLSFITQADVVKHTDPVPTGAWTLYYKTDVSTGVNIPQANYTITLVDDKNLASQSVSASTPYVEPTSVQTYTQLIAAVNAASSGAVIVVDGHLTCQDSDGGSEINITNKSITIRGKTGTTNDIIDANTKGRIFSINNDGHLTLENVTLQNGKVTGSGAGIYMTDTGATPSLVLNNTIIKNCEAKNGGGINLEAAGTVTMKNNSKIEGCTATMNGGGVYMSDGTFKMSGNTTSINDCEATTNGGGVHIAAGTFTMSGSACVTAASDKNDVYLPSGKMITVNSTLSATTAARITPERHSSSVQVLNGDIASNNTKFRVTPPNPPPGTGEWKVKDDGFLIIE